MLLSKSFLDKALSEVTCVILNGKDEEVVDESWPSFGQEVSVSIDSRTIERGELFLALKGPQFDGHNFVKQALEKGAVGLVIHDRACLRSLPVSLKKNILVIVVSDTMQALTDLAKAWREQLDIPRVAITGSVGKTSTKEILKNILHIAKINAFVSYKNQNNLIGLPLNILRVKKEHKLAVFELGINQKGEMGQLTDILQPTIALITNIAHAHGEGLGTLHDICYEKRQIFKFFTSSNIGIIFGDQDILTQVFYHHPVAKFGFKTKNQVQARKLRIIEDKQGHLIRQFILKWYGKKALISMQGNHQGAVNNALAASSLAYLLDVPFDVVVKGVQMHRGVEKRFETKKLTHYKGSLISDCYNANPESMKAALIAFNQMKIDIGSKIAVLGDMLELGEKEVYWHRQIGRVVSRMESIDSVILVGKRAWFMAETISTIKQVIKVNDWQDACQRLEACLSKEKSSLVLVKASLSINLGKVVEKFAS